MMTIEDFTELEEGTLVASDGPVCRCPHCGRNGILRSGSDGRVRFVHAEASRMFGDGMSVDAEDYCTMPEMTVAHELA